MIIMACYECTQKQVRKQWAYDEMNMHDNWSTLTQTSNVTSCRQRKGKRVGYLTSYLFSKPFLSNLYNVVKFLYQFYVNPCILLITERIPFGCKLPLLRVSLKSHSQVPNVVIAKLSLIPSSQSSSYHFMPYTFVQVMFNQVPLFTHTYVSISNIIRINTKFSMYCNSLYLLPCLVKQHLWVPTIKTVVHRLHKSW